MPNCYYYCSSPEWFISRMSRESTFFTDEESQALNVITADTLDTEMERLKEYPSPYILFDPDATSALVFTQKSEMENYLRECFAGRTKTAALISDENAQLLEQSAAQRFRDAHTEYEHLENSIGEAAEALRNLRDREESFVSCFRSLNVFLDGAADLTVLTELARLIRQAEQDDLPNKDGLVHLMKSFGGEPIEPRPGDRFLTEEHTYTSTDIPADQRVVSRLRSRGWKIRLRERYYTLLSAEVEIE